MDHKGIWNRLQMAMKLFLFMLFAEFFGHYKIVSLI